MKAVEELTLSVGTSVACDAIGVPRATAHRHRQPKAATAPKQVWTSDITKLLGPAKSTYSYLYVISDIYSRYVVGWMLASR